MGKLNLMTALFVEHVNKGGKVLWRAENLKNILHTEGEQYILEGAFAGQAVETFYFGLDARTTLDAADTMTELVDEPFAFGYERQTVDNNGWVIDLNSGYYNEAVSDILTFSADGGDWGPINNIFLTTQSGASGLLIASVALGENVTVTDGTSKNMRLSIALRDI